MQLVLLLSTLLIGASTIAAASDPLFSCGQNEEFNTCYSPCFDKKCPEKDAPAISCIMVCRLGCSCKAGYMRNGTGHCIKEAECPPIESSHLTCGPNEEANECFNPCTERKCPSKFAPLVNCLMACQNGCSCKAGHMRNMKGQCVKKADCPAIEDNVENPCNVVDCRPGTSCVVRNNKAVCTAVKPTKRSPEDAPPPGITCANVRCGTKGGCGMVEPMGCRNCKRKMNCLDVNNCVAANCSSNEECVLVEVQCLVAPCHPIAECRPKAPKVPRPLVQIREPRQSAPSCMTARCATPAGCAMIKPMSCGNSQDCQLIPACIHHNACSTRLCANGHYCVLHEVNCVKAPCDPIAKCEPIPPQPGDVNCPKNEIHVECKSPCSDVECNKEPKMCLSAVCLGGGCVCQEGFFRNKSGNCVTQNECDSH